MNDGSAAVQRFRAAYCPECRKEYPIPSDDYERLQLERGSMTCPHGHRMPATAAAERAPKGPAPERATRFCAYCRAQTEHTRAPGGAIWVCLRREKHPEHALHWLEDAVARGERRDKSVELLENEVAQLRTRVCELEAQLAAIPPVPDEPGPASVPPPTAPWPSPSDD